MLCREIIAVCSQIHTKHINTVCGQNVELLNVKLVVQYIYTYIYIYIWGRAVAYCLRHYTTSRQIAGSIPVDVLENFSVT